MKRLSIFLPLVILIASCDGTLSSTSSLPTSSTFLSSSNSSMLTSQPSQLAPIVNIDLYNLNDFHGAVEHNPSNKELGINRLAGYFKTKLAENPNSVFLSSGDMWQGSADSNITRGRLVVDAMNQIGFSAMAIGNHEFDWTDEYLFLNQTRSDFPLLGINIMDKETNQRAAFADASIMIERSGIQIGIIGTIGASLESTILTSAVAPYDFVPYTNLVNDESQRLKNLGADLIVLLNHDGTVESGVMPYVDAVFNGHTHRREVFHVGGKPVYQGQAYGQAISHVRFAFNTANMIPSFIQNQSGVYTYESLLSSNMFPLEDSDMNVLYEEYLVNEINDIKNEMIGEADGPFSRQQLGQLAVDEMLRFGQTVKQDVVASFHNSGGVRSTIDDGPVTYGELYKAFPFDNELMIVEVTGSELLWWLSSGLYMKTIANLTPVDTTQSYWIISINFLTERHLESSAYPHDLTTIMNTYQYIREQLKTRWLSEETIRASDYN